MADCGNTGSAIDRSARIITSAIVGQHNGANDATLRAGKAIGSFLGTASVPTASATAGLMPSAPPNVLKQPNNSLGLMTYGDQIGVGSRNGSRMGDPNFTSSNVMHYPPTPQVMHLQHNNRMQSHHDMRMQMNISMMNQQMAMMHMSQMQQRQMAYQAQLDNQQSQSLGSQRNINNKERQENKTTAPIKNKNESHAETNINEWHEHLEDEFQSYLDSYGHGSLTTDDVVSTHEREIGHEGNVEGATIEKLAAAWAEAEKEYLENDDYTNLASSYPEYEYNDISGTGVDTSYRYNNLSQNYGYQQESEKYVDLMSEGMKHFEQGNTKEAILCFESHLQNIDPDSSEAWLMLGKCNAENDEDRKAIACLENSVERDPYSSEALLSLGVSYVNELNYDQALKHLTNWVTHNPNLDVSVDIESDEINALNKVKELLRRAKDYNESSGNGDSTIDVLEALGVVYNVSREYEDAVDCFRVAANMRPGDYQLWNKLGATLANSQKSEEAQLAYQKALSIKPKYARAWLNMAIAHSNLQNHDEAARCYLQTLSLNPEAVHIWSYLRISLTCSEKWDLLPLAASQDISVFKQHFDFVQY